MQVRRCAGVQEYRSAVVQEYRSIGVLECRSASVPVRRIAVCICVYPTSLFLSFSVTSWACACLNLAS